MFNVVLMQPEIPQNTGAIGRLCLATGSRLHLVKPLGFSLSQTEVQRAGLDYWQEVDLLVHNSLEDLFPNGLEEHREGSIYLLTTKSERPYSQARFAPGDFLIFGRESRGLPESILEQHQDRTLTIPTSDQVRSLNLATAVGVVLYEAMRQNDFGGLP